MHSWGRFPLCLQEERGLPTQSCFPPPLHLGLSLQCWGSSTCSLHCHFPSTPMVPEGPSLSLSDASLPLQGCLPHALEAIQAQSRFHEPTAKQRLQQALSHNLPVGQGWVKQPDAGALLSLPGPAGMEQISDPALAQPLASLWPCSPRADQTSFCKQLVKVRGRKAWHHLMRDSCRQSYAQLSVSARRGDFCLPAF